VPDGLIEDWWVMPCWRLQALGRHGGGVGNEMFRQKNPALRGQG
jgi:hypothetical protein